MSIAFERVRLVSTPSPDACRWCGRERTAHGVYFVRSVGDHGFVTPTVAQRKARMLARRSQKQITAG